MTSSNIGVEQSVAIAGYPAELRTIDLRTFRRRDDALCSIRPSSPRARDTLDLICVARLESIVDRDELLRATNPIEPPYWALPWIGARAIAARMIAHPPSPSDYVLDLGCGLGLAGVAAGLSGARVTFADNVAAAVEFARANAKAHALREYETRYLDFTRDRLDRRFDWILAADIVYDPAHYGALVEFIDVHLTERGTLLLTESLRADARIAIEMLAGRGMRAATDAIWVVEDGTPERTWLHTLARR